MKDWKRKELWHKRGSGFCVEVSHHTEAPIHESNGTHRWCVYAYIYPTHPHFGEFNGNDLLQGAATKLPLHGGPSFLKYHKDYDGNITSVQIGADYNHLWDERYTFICDEESACDVFSDADELVSWLELSRLREEKEGK